MATPNFREIAFDASANGVTLQGTNLGLDEVSAKIDLADTAIDTAKASTATAKTSATTAKASTATAKTSATTADTAAAKGVAGATNFDAAVAALATLQADGASPTEAHVDAFQTQWDLLVTDLSDAKAATATAKTDATTADTDAGTAKTDITTADDDAALAVTASQTAQAQVVTINTHEIQIRVDVANISPGQLAEALDRVWKSLREKCGLAG